MLFVMRFLAILVVAFLMPACRTTTLRIENATDVDFSRVKVSLPDGALDYVDIRGSGGTSEARPVPRLYRYAPVEVYAADGRMWRIQPVDFVGESELAPNDYVYRLEFGGAAEQSAHLLLSCRKDPLR